MPHDHQHVLGDWHGAPGPRRPGDRGGRARARRLGAWSFEDRAAVFLRAAELLATAIAPRSTPPRCSASRRRRSRPRSTPRASSIDFLRFNVALRRSSSTASSRSPTRAIVEPDRLPRRSKASSTRSRRSTSRRSAATCRRAPALMGNTVRLEAGVDGDAERALHHAAADRSRACRRASSTSCRAMPSMISNAAALEPRPGGRALHRQHGRLQRDVEDDRRERSASYRSYPRIVGETGGKDFIVAHPSADAAGAGGGDRARRVRVPGAEVLGREPRLRPEVALDRRARPGRSR